MAVIGLGLVVCRYGKNGPVDCERTGIKRCEIIIGGIQCPLRHVHIVGPSIHGGGTIAAESRRTAKNAFGLVIDEPSCQGREPRERLAVIRLGLILSTNRQVSLVDCEAAINKRRKIIIVSSQ